MLHEALDEFGGAVAWHDVVLPHAEAFARQQRVDVHARGVLREQRVEVGAHFVEHAGRGEVGVHQVAEVGHVGEAPVAPVASHVLLQLLVAFGKECVGNVEVLNVVNFVPLAVAHGQRLEFALVEEGDDAQHLLVVFVVAQRLAVSFEERHVFVACKVAAELVDVHRFVVAVGVFVFEGFLGHEVHNVAVLVDAHHGAVHPRLVFRHQREVGVGVVEYEAKHVLVEDKVALDEQRVVLLQLLLGQGERVDVVGFVVDGVVHILNVQHVVVALSNVVLEFLSLVAHHYHHALQREA